ncbi:SanA/YdcF family protein [Fulvivirga ligni]|uniref:SanA/YdcF family protein n=1 Tax=Fulvivirga ligni TaxID=2904246 RepID=UPI001F325756|nr:ElyC/SanA/YdcF family protein [Fulvivirga ligni]UII19842.1 YdcF family protein [Fulvivirga ligni]
MKNKIIQFIIFVASHIRTFTLIITGVSISMIILVLAAKHHINSQTQGQLYTQLDSLPYKKAGLLLGTSKKLKSGAPNPFFKNRIEAAASIFKAGKINYLVISGDNSRTNYNEPQDMKDALVKKGIPANRIYLDYAGFRTLDSIHRMKEIFEQDSFTIISQEFHNRRALYIANALELNTIAFNAEDAIGYNNQVVQAREYLARVKVLLDIAINKQPKFLGDKIAVK